MSVRRNTVFGALGFALPTVVVFLAYPVVLERLGAADMGVYMLAVSLSGTFGFLEFGLTTVTTKLIAEAVAGRDSSRASDAVATSLAFYLGLGVIGTIGLWLAAPALALWASAPDVTTAVRVFRIAAVLLVSSYVNNVAVSVMKGIHRFDHATLQATGLSVATWGGAVLAVLAGGGVVAVAAASLAANVSILALSIASTVLLCRRLGIHLAHGRPRTTTLRPMLRLGAFMSLNGLAGILSNQVQNLIMARVLTPAAIAVWGTAVQIVSRVNALSSAAFEVVLPVAAELHELSTRTEARVRILRSIYLKALGLSLAFSVSASGVLYVVSAALIRFWLHSPIDEDVTSVLRILCIGIAVNGGTPVAYHLLNGVGRPAVNSAFMMAGTVMLYGTLFVFSWSGLDISRFAVATSLTLFVNGLLYLAFCEIVVWRRWLLGPFRPAPREST